MKKLLLAIVAAYIVLMLTNYLVHQIWLMSDYAAIPASHRSTEEIMHRFWGMAVGQFIFAALFAYIYTCGVDKKPWLVQGIRYGILVALLTVVPTALSEYVVYIVPHQLAIKWMIAGGIQMIILGLLVAGIYGESAG
jgi:putative flippase GtrA